MDLVSLHDVQLAAQRIQPVAMRTPLLPFIDNLWLKPENLQPTGAFKIRGAMNAVSALAPKAVITHSSGNHGRALAYAAKRLGIAATVVMPDTSPQIKIDAVSALGAEIVIVPPAQREATARTLAAERAATFIPPFDHPAVIAGQGTIGLEILSDLPDADVIVVPVGGGGLISGVAAAVKALHPATRIIGVEPALAAEARQSLHRGQLTTWPTEMTYRTVADGVRTAPSALTFAHMQAYVDDIVTVDDEQILQAVRDLALVAKLVVEPSGAVAVAACASGRIGQGTVGQGKTVAVVSGGNIEASLLRACLADKPEPAEPEDEGQPPR
jgi:threonine dehydratase